MVTKPAHEASVASTLRTAIADQGAALRVPSPLERRAWGRLIAWLGEEGEPLAEAAGVQVWTETGWVIALPGDWIVLSVTGAFHVAASPRKVQA